MDFDMIDPADFAKPGAGDEKLLVVFYMGILQDEAKSTTEGRPIYVDTEYVRIFCPGDKNNVVDRPVRATDKVRFPKQYAAFKAGGGEDAQLEGTPLKDWPMIGRALTEELRHIGIRTVEQLSEARDDVCLRVPGLTTLKQTAGVWLQKSKSTAEAAKIAKALDDIRSENGSLQETVRNLMATNELLQNQLREHMAKA